MLGRLPKGINIQKNISLITTTLTYHLWVSDQLGQQTSSCLVPNDFCLLEKKVKIVIKDIQEAGLKPEMTLSTRDLEGKLSKREGEEE